MKNKFFGVWFKELCSLVFVQSMQALLLTIMLAVVVRLYVADKDPNNTVNQSMAVYIILILTAIPKVELLVKKIFGLGSGVMNDSMMGGKQSLMAGMVTYKLGTRLFDNVKKIGSGAAGLLTGKGGGPGKRSTSRLADNNNKALTSTSSSGGNSTQLNRIAEAIQNATETPEEAKSRNRRESLKRLTGGVAETIGAIGGASVGAVFSLGTGGDNMFDNVVRGAGIGDIVGEKVNDMAFTGASAAASGISTVTSSVGSKISAHLNDRKANRNNNSAQTNTNNSSKDKNKNTNTNADTNKKRATRNPDATSEARRQLNKALRAQEKNDMKSFEKHKKAAMAIMKASRNNTNTGNRHSSSNSSNSINSVDKI